MVHTVVVLHVNIVLHDTNQICEEPELIQALEDNDFEEYLNNNTLTWDDNLTIEEIKILEVQKNHYVFIDIDHELDLEVLDIVLQEWVIQSSYSPHLYDFFGNKSAYLDIVDAVIVNDCTIPESFAHLLKVTILDEQERTFLTDQQKVIKVTPPTMIVLGIKEGNKIITLSETIPISP